MYTPFNPPMENYFPPSQHQFFLPHLRIFICVHSFYLLEPFLIHDHLQKIFFYSWSSVRIIFYPWSSVKISFYSWSSVRIIFHSWSSVRISSYSWSSVKIFFYLSKSIFICAHLFLSMRISFYLWSCKNLFLSIICLRESIFLSLYENK